ncbi:hypothetical protein AAVH_01874 [Aphelenchoides avenae]|nr:hypothetical protein AAVH_01874 [Aphelenchus avenae]
MKERYETEKAINDLFEEREAIRLDADGLMRRKRDVEVQPLENDAEDRRKLEEDLAEFNNARMRRNNTDTANAPDKANTTCKTDTAHKTNATYSADYSNNTVKAIGQT